MLYSEPFNNRTTGAGAKFVTAVYHRNCSSQAHQVFGGPVIINCDKRETVRIKETFPGSRYISPVFFFTIFVHHRFQASEVNQCCLYVMDHMFVYVRLHQKV